MMPTKEQGEEAFQTAMLAAQFRKGRTMTTQAQIETVWNEMSPQLKVLIAKALNHALAAAPMFECPKCGADLAAVDTPHKCITAVAEVGAYVCALQTGKSGKRCIGLDIGWNDSIERCACWLNEEAKSLRSMVSGGDGSEKQWIEADALDRASVQLRTLKG